MANEQQMDTKARRIITAVLLAGSFVAILNQTLMATAIPHVMEDFNISENTAQWLTTIFMLVNGVMIPITAFLIETYTTRKLFIGALVIFAIGTLVCGIAPTYPLLLAGRVIQAAGAGIMMPLMMTVFLNIFPIEKRGAAMGNVGLVISFAPAIGPTLSGWIIVNYPWRMMFFIILPIIIIDIIFAYFAMKNVTKQTYPKVDYLSIVLSSLGFGGLLYGFSSAGNIGWGDLQVIASLVVGAISLTVFILRQFKLAQPILEFRVFRYRTFTIATVIGAIVFIGLIGAETILPIYVQNMLGYSALEAGMMIMPGALLMGVMSPVTGRIFDRIGARWLAVTGLSLMTITTFLYTDLSTETSLSYLTVVFTIRMLGIAMVMMPITTAGLNVLPPHLISHGTAMNNTMRQVGASIGTAVLITVMTTAALDSGPDASVSELIHGVNVAFWVATGISLFAVILSFFIKENQTTVKRKVAQEVGEKV